ncbi:MAG: hypothetical protein KatS3mg087_1175 [Patescibacteria group bacterium]|nr:MAG: hypothetical protein KatS3mg087_1175 [Patescibacteria group bacterium]
MKVAALCPTFRHPTLLQNSLALWLNQTYPLSSRKLFILDDDPSFNSQSGDGWELVAVNQRLPSICDKYNTLLEMANGYDVILVWEDDDIYLPRYVENYVNALQNADLCYPSIVLSDYGGTIHKEQSGGRFHSAIGVKTELLKKVGGWPKTKRADFDQILLSKLMQSCYKRALPWPDTAKFWDIQFLYRWHTGHAHCQNTMKSPSDETWYDEAVNVYQKVPFVGKLTPKLDIFTSYVLELSKN